MKGENVFVERYLTPLAVLLAAVIIAFAFIYGRGAGAPTDQGAAGAKAVDIAEVNVDDSPYVGEKNAPTAVAIFYDYQCPFCKQFEQQVTPKIIDAYVKSGKTKVVFKDFQFLGQDSDDAAVFGRALWDAQPDLFYPWYVAMFNAQDDEGDQGFGDMASIEKLAATVDGIDVAKVSKLATEKRDDYEKAIAADRAEGASFGINGTPSIIVGKELLSGSSPDQFYAKISASLDAQLKK